MTPRDPKAWDEALANEAVQNTILEVGDNLGLQQWLGLISLSNESELVYDVIDYYMTTRYPDV